MKIALIGYGKMGVEVEKAALAKGIEVVSRIDPFSEKADFKEVSKESLGEAEVAIDFSSSSAVLENIRRVCAIGKNMVVGTTGWYDSIEEAKKIVSSSNIGFIYSPNYSIGTSVFFKIVEETAKVINKLEEYDACVWEAHHRQKADAPSGTAKTIAEILLKNIERKKKIVLGNPRGKICEEELQVSSIRVGFNAGEHVVCFDGETDSIELRHSARSRSGFAKGAVMAAQWISGRKGFYSMNDFVEDFLEVI